MKERDLEGIMFENNTLYGKLENLENVFIGSSIAREGLNSAHSKMSQDYTTSTLILENTELKKKIVKLEGSIVVTTVVIPGSKQAVISASSPEPGITCTSQQILKMAIQSMSIT